MRSWLSLAVVCAVLASCGDGPRTGDGPAGGTTGGEDPGPGDPAAAWGDSAATPFAREMTSLILAALEGRPLPTIRFEVPDDHRPVRVRGDIQTAGSVPVAFLLRLDVGLARDGEAAPDRWLRLGAIVTRDGLRLTEIAERNLTGHAPSRPLADVGDLRTLVRGILDDLRGGRVGGRRFGETDGEALGATALATSLRGLWTEPPNPAELEGLAPVAVRVADLALLARDRSGVSILAEVDVHVDGDRLVLRGDPVVDVTLLTHSER